MSAITTHTRARAREAGRRALPAPVYRILRRHRIRRKISSYPARQVAHTYGGEVLKVAIRDPLAEGWYDHDWGPQPEIDALRNARLRPGSLVFDLGAHQAVVALMLGRIVGREGRVIAVEAEPHNAAVAEENCRLNAADNVEVVQAAIAERAGTMYFSEELNGAFHPGGRIGRIAVPAVTLDELAGRYGRPDVVFLDVEGFEGAALRGAAGLLAAGKTDFFVELHDAPTLEECGTSPQEVVEHLSAAGLSIEVGDAEAGEMSGGWVALAAGLHLRGTRCYLIARSQAEA